MKRSEMINKFSNLIFEECHNWNLSDGGHEELRRIAEQFLNLAEKVGMLPPYRPVVCENPKIGLFNEDFLTTSALILKNEISWEPE